MSISSDVARLRALCPDYPPTPHLGQITSPTVPCLVTEKLDGANAALMLDEDRVVVRNRTHVLRKGYAKDTPAKSQFAPLFTWGNDRRKALRQLHNRLGGRVAVYGEWLWAVHGVLYSRLPAPFVAFALWRTDSREFVDPVVARTCLEATGWTVPPLIGQGRLQADWLISRTSAWGDELAEGAVINWGDGRRLLGCAKWVRPDYQQNHRWSDEQIQRHPKLPRT